MFIDIIIWEEEENSDIEMCFDSRGWREVLLSVKRDQWSMLENHVFAFLF